MTEDVEMRTPQNEDNTEESSSPGRELMDTKIRQILTDHAHLPVTVAALRDNSDLYQAGLTSHASVNLMLALEDSFDVEFPQSMLRKKTFSSIATIRSTMKELISTQH